MSDTAIHAVTGAFSYSGRYIASELLERGHRVITLTNSPNKPSPFGEKVQAFRLAFDDPAALEQSLRGVAVLYNTYWVRFNHRDFNHDEAVRNSSILFDAARRAGVQRIVHVSITNPSEQSNLSYFSGKARVEKALVESGLSHAILRPTVLFGKEDILINNIAWILRKFPVFGVFGSGAYKLQPIYVGDLAALAAEHGVSDENVVLNAIGPETYTFRDMVRMIARAIGVRRPILPMPPVAGHAVGSILGALTGDVVITRAEIEGLMQGLLYVTTPPTGTTKLSEWATKNADRLGKTYAHELSRRRG